MISLIIGTDDPERSSIYVNQQGTLKTGVATQVRNDGPITIQVIPVITNPTPGATPVLIADSEPTDTYQVAVGEADQSPAGGTFELLFKGATISTSSVANPTVITTSTPHLLLTGDTIFITGHTGSTPAIAGAYTIIKTGASTFTIPVNVSVGGTGGTVYLTTGTTAIAYDISDTALQAAIAPNFVKLGYNTPTVEDIGDSSFRIFAILNGAIPTGFLVADSDLLIPTCDIPINEVELGDADTPYRLVMQLRRAPIAYCEPATPLPATGVTATATQALSATQNAITTIAFDNVTPVSGTFSISAYALGVTRTIGIAAWNLTAAEMQALLETHPQLSGNVTVTKPNAGFQVEFNAAAGPKLITSSTLANPTVITTNIPHGYANGQTVTHSGTNSTPNTDGAQVVTVISSTTYSVPVNVTTAGTTGTTRDSTTPSLAVTNIDLLGPQGFSGSLYLNTENFFEDSLTETTESYFRLFSVTRTRASGERETILGPIAIQLFKDIVDRTTMIPVPFASYYTTVQSDARFGQLAVANTWTDFNEFTGNVQVDGGLVVGSAIACGSSITLSNDVICGGAVQCGLPVFIGVGGGANTASGTFTLVAGTKTVANNTITANSVVLVTLKTNGGVRSGNPDIVPTSGVGFVATGAGTDTSTYNYVIVEKN